MYFKFEVDIYIFKRVIIIIDKDILWTFDTFIF